MSIYNIYIYIVKENTLHSQTLEFLYLFSRIGSNKFPKNNGIGKKIKKVHINAFSFIILFVLRKKVN